MKKNSICIIANPLVFFGVPFGAICFIALLLLPLILNAFGAELSGDVGLWWVFDIFIGAMFAYYIYAAIRFMPVSHMILRLTPEGVEVIRPFHKTCVSPYHSFRVYVSRYFEGNASGAGVFRYFIIFTKRRYSQKELSDPSSIKVDRDTFKVLCRKSVMKKLENVLPEYLLSQLKNQIGG